MIEREPQFFTLDYPEIQELTKENDFSRLLIYELSKAIVDSEYPNALQIKINDSDGNDGKIFKPLPPNDPSLMAGRLQDALADYQGQPFEKFREHYASNILSLKPDIINKAIKHAYASYASDLNKFKKIH